MRNGKGDLFFTNGNHYSGQFRNNKMHGQGQLFHKKEESTYKGSFKNSLPDGYGVQITKDGYSYKGYYKRGKYHGKGTLVYYDKSYYVGEFKNGIREGKGTMHYSNDDIYIGMFKNDK